jgi:hypothetical protein
MTKHYVLLGFLAFLVIGFFCLRGCAHATGRALSGPAPAPTVIVNPK